MVPKDEQYWEEVEGSLRGKPSSSAESAEFQQDLQLQQQLEDGIAYVESRDLKARLQKLHQEEVKSGGARVRSLSIRSRVMRWGAAAAILLIGVVAATLWIPSSTPSDLYSEFYQPSSLDLTRRGEATAADLSRAESLYDAGNYREALPVIDALLQREGAGADLQLAKAITHWEMGEKTLAKQTLEPLFEHPLMQDQAYWYAALFALEEEDASLACTYLQRISDRGGKWYEQGKTLLRRLSC